MNHVSSAATLASASSQRSKSSEISTFERILPQMPENIEVTVHRGMRFAFSPRLAGHGKASKAHEDTAKSYNITVEPHGRMNMVKEITKYGEVEELDDSLGLELPKLRFNDDVMDAIIEERHDRSVFRKERLRKFNQHRFMPALVSTRLVPCWRAAGGTEEVVNTPAVEAKRKLKAAVLAMQALAMSKPLGTSEKSKKKERRRYQRRAFVTPTVSIAMKRTQKVDVEPPGWHTSGNAHDLVHPTVRAFDSGGGGCVWEQVERQKVSDYNDSKKRWLAHDVIPAGVAHNSEDVQEIRNQSKVSLQNLKTQYDQNRAAHKKSSTASGTKSFERYCQDYKFKKKLAAEEAARQAADEKQLQESCWRSNLAGGLSLGLSKHRATQPDLNHGGALPTEAPA